MDIKPLDTVYPKMGHWILDLVERTEGGTRGLTPWKRYKVDGLSNRGRYMIYNKNGDEKEYHPSYFRRALFKL